MEKEKNLSLNFKLQQELTGQTTGHLIWSEDDQTYIHKDVYSKLNILKKLASENGFSLAFFSGFRSFDQQKKIIEKKISGKRPILDDLGHVKKVENLTPKDLLFSILRWSALPGFSRHHWGSDFDVYDKNSLPHNYSIQLTPNEYENNGPFASLGQWLQKLSTSPKNPGFFFPYKKDLGGVAIEPWHISFSPQTPQFENFLNHGFFHQFVYENEIPLKEIILEHSQNIFSRFIAASFFNNK